MTKVLFAYNGRVEVDPKGNYYGNELNDQLVERYKFFGEKVRFLVRSKKISESHSKEIMPFQHPDLNIRTVEDFTSSLKDFGKAFSSIRKVVKKEVSETDVLIARLPSLIGRIAINEAKKMNKPYMVEVVGCPWDALWNHSLLGRVYAPIAYLALKKQVKTAPYVLYVTKQFLQKRYPTNGYSVGVTDVVLKSIEESSLESRLSKIDLYNTGKTLKLGTAAGYDVEYKGQQYVIEAISKASNKNFNFKYEPVGKGSGKRLAKLIESLNISDKVTLKGQLKHNEIFDYFDEIDIYIQPSKQEGLPRAVVEAMSRACPVLGSKTGGIPELIDEEYIFGKGDVEQIVNCLNSLDKIKLKKMAKSNFEKSKEYSTNKMNKARLDFYLEFKKSYD